jgi:hypothetical protein
VHHIFIIIVNIMRDGTAFSLSIHLLVKMLANLKNKKTVQEANHHNRSLVVRANFR